MPRRPKRPNKKHKFRLQVILDGALVAAIDAAAARHTSDARGGPVEHVTTRSDVVRMALRKFVSTP